MNTLKATSRFWKFLSFGRPRIPTFFVVAMLLTAFIARADDFTEVNVSDFLEANAAKVDNDLTVNGALYVGPPNYFDDFPELQIYTTTGFPGTVQFGTYNPATWIWGYNYDFGPFPYMTAVMILNTDSTLMLYNGYGNLALDPGNQTLFFENDISLAQSSGNLFINGAGGNLAFDPSNSTLTINGTTTLDLTNLGGSYITLPGDSGFAPGNGATASGFRSAALGGNGTAAGASSVSLANGTANQDFSLAAGNQSVASGTNSVALSGGNVGTNGTAAMAVGSGAFANSTGAIALGNGTTAQSWSTVTVGHYNSNITANSTTTWAAVDPAFVVGVGNNSTRANGLVIYNSGNITMPKRQGDIYMGSFTNITADQSP